ncbi:asparaginase [Patescibacteria group bacterium]
MKRPKIRLIFAGGTIGMRRNSRTGALHPAHSAADILKKIPELQKIVRLDFKMLINIDSSNMEPLHWSVIANDINTNYDDYDGFVIVQGTDTMSYTSSALSFALQKLSKPIVFTGSLIPMDEIGSDARNNLVYACLVSTLDIAEVCLVFGNRIMRANRSKKHYESLTAGFHSINFPYLGELGRPIALYGWRKKRRKRKLKFKPEFDSNISLLKLFPGFDPYILDRVIERGVHGLIIEGFGPGNVPFMEKSILPQIEKACKKNIPVVIANQMERGITCLYSYEAGYKALKVGAISSKDMTTEATVSKLMWCLAQNRNDEEVKKLMEKNLAGELEE